MGQIFVEYLLENLLTVLMLVALLIVWLSRREIVVDAIKWLAAILTEEGSGKPSLSRVIGVWLTWAIVDLTYKEQEPGVLQSLWMLSIGYMFLSKALGSVSPAILEFAKGYMSKWSAPKAPKEG